MFALFQKLLPKHLLSRVVGAIAASQNRIVRRLFIDIFCFFYDIDLSEAERADRRAYLSFNDFFTRALKPGARPVAPGICSPADGTIAALGRIDGDTLIQSKNHSYSLDKLLGEPAPEFRSGSFITVYLAPHNYHRVHSPCPGQLDRTRYIPGELFSVNQGTAAHLPDLFANNERLICRFDTPQGKMALVMVGAMLVAGIQTAWREAPYPPKLAAEERLCRTLAAGEEIGQFQMGSTVILVFESPLTFRVKEGDTVRYGQPMTSAS